MLLEKLKENWEKAEAKITKCEATIERHKKQAQKKLDIMNKNGWELEKKWEYTQGGEQPNHDAYWTICDYESKLEDIENAQKKLADAIRIAGDKKQRYENEVNKQQIISNDIPQQFLDAKNMLIEEWVRYDIMMKEDINLKIAIHGGAYEVAKKGIYKYSVIDYFRNKTEEEFREIETKSADGWLIDLYNRTCKITGKIINCERLHWGGKCLDGIIEGEKGTADVTTIQAGGYNIQRLHLRTLVKKIK